MYNSLFHLSYCQGTSPNIMFWTQQTEQRHLRPSVTPSDVEWHPQAPHLKPGEEHKETMGRVEVSVSHMWLSWVILSHPESSWVILSHPESSWVILYGMYLFPLFYGCTCPLTSCWYLKSTKHIQSIQCIQSDQLWPKRPVEAFVPPQDPLDEIKPNAWVVAKTGCPLLRFDSGWESQQELCRSTSTVKVICYSLMYLIRDAICQSKPARGLLHIVYRSLNLGLKREF